MRMLSVIAIVCMASASLSACRSHHRQPVPPGPQSGAEHDPRGGIAWFQGGREDALLSRSERRAAPRQRTTADWQQQTCPNTAPRNAAT